MRLRRSLHSRSPLLVVERNELLSCQFQAYGHEYKFEAKDAEEESSTSLSKTVKCGVGKELDTRWQVSDFEAEHPDINDLLPENFTIAAPASQGILQWLKRVYTSSRGFELGTFDPSLLTATMHGQSQKWEHLARGYISDIIALAHSFVAKTLRILCLDDRTWCGLVSVLKEHLVKKYQDALDMTEFILQVERSRTPMTLNHYFNDNLEKWSVQAPRKFFFILPLMFISVVKSVLERL